MALTGKDLQAISNLLDPINSRLDNIEGRLDNVEGRLDNVEGKLDKIDIELDKLNSQVSALQSGQLENHKAIKTLDIKVSEVYELALDAWGTSIENRHLLEKENSQYTVMK